MGDRGLVLPRPLGFVLGGGASLGAVQVGMLQALHDADIHPDMITGASVGALNGAVLAADAEHGVDRLADMWRHLQRQDVFPGHLIGLLWRLGRSRTHAVAATGMRSLLEGALRPRTFAELQIPLAVVALDVDSGDELVLDSGALVPALLASSAIPGVFAPVDIDGRSFVDGGVVANVPVHHAAARGARCLVVLDTVVPAPSVPARPTVATLVERITLLQFRAQLAGALPAVAGQIPVVHLPAPSPRLVSPVRFSDSAALIDDARAQSASFLADLRIDGPAVYGDPYSRYLVAGPNAAATALAASTAL